MTTRTVTFTQMDNTCMATRHVPPLLHDTLLFAADPRRTSQTFRRGEAKCSRDIGATDRWRGLIISPLPSILLGDTGFRRMCEVSRPVKPTQPWSRTQTGVIGTSPLAPAVQTRVVG